MTYFSDWDLIYRKRLILLQDTDWTQLPDSPLTEEKRAEWATFRQGLRDMPKKWPVDVDKENVNPFDTPDIFPPMPSK